MLDTAANDETISRPSIECALADRNSQMSTHDVDDLLVGVTGRVPIAFADWNEDEVGMCVVGHVVESMKTLWKAFHQPLLIQVRHSQVGGENLDDQKGRKISGPAHHEQRRVVAVRPFQHVSD